MTIARDAASGSGHDSVGIRRSSGQMPASELLDDETIPVELRADRLTRQIESFERAGYRLETRTALQAVVVRHRNGGFISTLLRPRRHHRVAITVDRSGIVRFA
ncbi:hypothetical protein [Amnibacterium kyonggiense]